MTTNDDEYRTKLLEAVERVQAQGAKFRAYLCIHMPGISNDQLDAIVHATDAKELTEDQLKATLYFHLGLPPGYSLTEDQLDMVLRSTVEGKPI
jgi:hypothetical protein